MGKNDDAGSIGTGGVLPSQYSQLGTIREFDPNVNKWKVYKKQLIQFLL